MQDNFAHTHLETMLKLLLTLAIRWASKRVLLCHEILRSLKKMQSEDMELRSSSQGRLLLINKAKAAESLGKQEQLLYILTMICRLSQELPHVPWKFLNS